MIANFGHVGGSCFAANSIAEGEGLKKATLGKESRLVHFCQTVSGFVLTFQVEAVNFCCHFYPISANFEPLNLVSLLNY